MLFAICCGVALLGAVFIWWSRQTKERVSLDPPLLAVSANGKYVIGFSLIFGALSTVIALYLKGALF